MILHITTQMELIKLEKSVAFDIHPNGKITTWQLARIYIYLAICQPSYDFKKCPIAIAFFRSVNT
jgi:hypothetical protein